MKMQGSEMGGRGAVYEANRQSNTSASNAESPTHSRRPPLLLHDNKNLQESLRRHGVLQSNLIGCRNYAIK